MSGRELLMTIGDFAHVTGLTPKALRLYDELGLLPPREVDPHSGYRRYAPSQIDRARLVATLRLLGMPLDRIKRVVDMSSAAAAKDIEAYWLQVEADQIARRSMVATLIHQWGREAHDMTTLTESLHAEFGSSHNQGARSSQQDALLVTPQLIAVADGYGDRDDLAAIALQAYARGGLVEAIATVAPEVNAALPSQPTAGTTLTAVNIDGATARIAHIGDGRVWLIREGKLRQLTHDHTIVAALIETGQLTEDEARSHAHRNLLNRALLPGVVAEELEVSLSPGDRLALTTDGVHSHLDGLEPLLTMDDAPQEVADAIAGAVARAGEPDNHTIIVADFQQC